MYNVAIIGATGAVGREILKTLEKREFPVKEMVLLASSRSAGMELTYKKKPVQVQSIEEYKVKGIDYAFFSAGADVSKEYAPIFADAGAVVIDNTSLYRMDEGIPLIVPEVNGDEIIGLREGIVANPNCSTIQMVLALKQIEKMYGLEKVVVSTYQSVSGSGQKGIKQLHNEIQGEKENMGVYPREIGYNVIPQIDVFTDNGFTKEEMKMINETRKIMRLPSLKVNATCVRVPVDRGHSESIYVETKLPIQLEKLMKEWGRTEGLTVKKHQKDYATPKETEKTDETYVGRIRKDLDNEKAMSFWVVSDNLLKGAALNSVQIAEKINERN